MYAFSFLLPSKVGGPAKRPFSAYCNLPKITNNFVYLPFYYYFLKEYTTFWGKSGDFIFSRIENINELKIVFMISCDPPYTRLIPSGKVFIFP